MPRGRARRASPLKVGAELLEEGSLDTVVAVVEAVTARDRPSRKLEGNGPNATEFTLRRDSVAGLLT
ncbi:MAG TPA: hypothetical protein VIJ34_10255 [Acidimicrobiales bacterium]